MLYVATFTINIPQMLAYIHIYHTWILWAIDYILIISHQSVVYTLRNSTPQWPMAFPYLHRQQKPLHIAAPFGHSCGQCSQNSPPPPSWVPGSSPRSLEIRMRHEGFNGKIMGKTKKGTSPL
jgi:hypothetical protein